MSLEWDDIQQKAALDRWRKENADRQRIRQLVTGANRQRRVSNIIRLADGDYLVEVDGTWTAVVDNQPGQQYYETQDGAMLDLITRRNGTKAHHTYDFVVAAGRVLGITGDQP